MFTSSDESKGVGAPLNSGDQVELVVHGPDFAAQAGKVAGIDVRSLPPGTELEVDTRNSRYRFVILDESGSNALVQGGPYFRQEAKVRIDGSLLGESLLKSGWIGLGLRVEMSAGSQRVVTSRVRSISVD
jgi:CRISPR/Cas system-associated exonuclease Cas4 (RecB family)